MPLNAALKGLALVGSFAALLTPGASGLGWPLDQDDARRRLSSSFCEYRGSHLHGGVDLSTGGEVGVPVLAAADGEIYRVKVKYRGLGRALYLRHENGLITVYGHLAGFSGPLGNWVEKQLARRGRYPGDLWPKTPVRVRQGERIAWSGQTGGGPPHLHFETRRGGGSSPVDPFAAGLPCLDEVPPDFKELLIVPFDRAATVSQRMRGSEGEALTPTRIDLHSDTVLHLSGAYRLLVRVEDPLAAGTGGVTRLKASVGGQTLLDFHADRFTYGQTGQVGLLMNRSLSRTSPTAFWYWLHDLPGNDLPFMKGASVLDTRTLPRGAENVLLIEAGDGCGNVRQVRVRIKVPATVSQPSEAWPWSWSWSWPELEGAEADAGFELKTTVASATRAARVRAGRAELQVPAGVVGEEVEVGLRFSLALPPHLATPGVMRAEPFGLPMKGKARILFEAPSPGTWPRQQLGVFRKDPASGAWVYWGDDIEEPGWLGVSTDRLGVFALMFDDQAPALVSAVRTVLEDQPWRAGGEALVVSYSESGKGVPWDGIRVEWDGSEGNSVAEHDPDLGQAILRLPDSAAGKELRGVVILGDRAGNESRHRLTFPAIP